MISIDGTSFVPPYEQIRSQLAAQISSGALPAGARLPTVRQLAGDLGLAVNTVARAYRELEAAGLVATHGRGGTTVTSGGDTVREQIRQAAADYADCIHQFGLDQAEALDLVKAALQARAHSHK